jgi:hypothetical protein
LTAANQEDLELENVEFATKLSELTLQAKKMLLNNESLEEEIQDQQVEYEDRIAELEKYSAELESKLAEKVEENELLLLHQEHGEALKAIEKLSTDNDAIEQLTVGTEQDKNSTHEEESSELHKGGDIVSELKAKNEEISSLLRFSQEQNDAAADFISCLKSDNAKLRKIISEHGKLSAIKPATETLDDKAIVFTEQLELQNYKSTVLETAIDHGPGPSQLRLWDAPVSPAIKTNPGSASHQFKSSSLVSDMMPSLSYVRTESGSTALPIQIIQQIENLTIENNKLAMRLGNAVAEKEFALTTLSKLGAKVEELMERNRLLSDPFDVKIPNGRIGAGHKSSERIRNDTRGRDPDEVKSTASSSNPREMAITIYQAGHDDATAYSDMASTIMSYEQSKKVLEPESASVVKGMMEDDNIKRRKSACREPPNDSNTFDGGNTSEPILVKVPGGEYFGTLNTRGQKHGSGKMKYDNGNVYDGEWTNNKRDGKGITQYASGNLYTGTIVVSGYRY